MPAITDPKIRARKLLNRAVESGRVQKQPCEHCGSERVQAHHDDYSKPLEVRWWCASCHSRFHNQKHPATSNCVVCGREFTPAATKRGRALTCSRECHAKREHQQLATLTVDQMAAIKRRYDAGGITQEKLGKEFGVDRTRVSQIVRGQASRIQGINMAIALSVRVPA